MSLNRGNCDSEHRHRCGIRYLCHLRHKKGLSWFRNYISDKNFSKVVLDDFFEQYKHGNKGEWGTWIELSSQQQGLGI
jgi:hypothetical protein